MMGVEVVVAVAMGAKDMGVEVVVEEEDEKDKGKKESEEFEEKLADENEDNEEENLKAIVTMNGNTEPFKYEPPYTMNVL